MRSLRNVKLFLSEHSLFKEMFSPVLLTYFIMDINGFRGKKSLLKVSCLEKKKSTPQWFPFLADVMFLLTGD